MRRALALLAVSLVAAAGSFAAGHLLARATAPSRHLAICPPGVLISGACILLHHTIALPPHAPNEVSVASLTWLGSPCPPVADPPPSITPGYRVCGPLPPLDLGPRPESHRAQAPN